MEPEEFGGIGNAPLRALQSVCDEDPLELRPRIFVAHTAIEHLLNERVELIAHGSYCRSRPDSTRNASTYFARVCCTTSSGSDGTGGCLFHAIASR
jgi:hypothetical protein